MNFKNVTSTKFLKECDVEDEVVEQLKEIDLSTDEEDEDDECEVIIFKRQTITESTVEEVNLFHTACREFGCLVVYKMAQFE